LSLETIGWTATLRGHLDALARPDLEPVRIITDDGLDFGVIHADGPARATASGRLLDAAAGDRAARPVVGDWVAARPAAPARFILESVLPRRTRFGRAAPSARGGTQIVAANVDLLVLVAGLDDDWNLRRLERGIALARSGGIDPLIVLNKADLDPARVPGRLAATLAVAGDVPVLVTSAAAGEGIDDLRARLQPGRTVALAGSSGVGKSSLVNALLGTERQATGTVRSADGRGRHTTTRRELLVLPGGAVLIDRPGFREFGLPGAEDADRESAAVDGTFDEIADLARACRFRDCAHESEPGCAVLAALASGDLPAERLDAWHLLRRESGRATRAEQRRRSRLIRKAQRVRRQRHGGLHEPE